MKIQCRLEKQCAILDIQEDRLEYPKTVLLKNYLIRLLQDGHYKLALNIANVRSLDSFGLAVIISMMKECRKHKGDLCLYGLNDFNTKLVEMTRLDKVLTICQTEKQAIKHFSVRSITPGTYS